MVVEGGGCCLLLLLERVPVLVHDELMQRNASQQAHAPLTPAKSKRRNRSCCHALVFLESFPEHDWIGGNTLKGQKGALFVAGCQTCDFLVHRGACLSPSHRVVSRT